MQGQTKTGYIFSHSFDITCVFFVFSKRTVYAFQRLSRPPVTKAIVLSSKLLEDEFHGPYQSLLNDLFQQNLDFLVCPHYLPNSAHESIDSLVIWSKRGKDK